MVTLGGHSFSSGVGPKSQSERFGGKALVPAGYQTPTPQSSDPATYASDNGYTTTHNNLVASKLRPRFFVAVCTEAKKKAVEHHG